MNIRETTPPTLPRRRREAHKGDFGRVLVIGGSVGYTGAPLLAARGAVRAGAGLVSVAVPREAYPAAAAQCLEIMARPWPREDAELLAFARGQDAVVLGPGLGRGMRGARLTRLLLRELTCPVVLDADGLNALAGHMDSLDGRAAPTVLTPHEGEFARLTGQALPLADRARAAGDFAMAHRCTLVLKGWRTVIAAPDGACLLNTTGNPGMARGGSGDVLSGMLAALLAQGLEGAAAAAVWLHGRAGDLAAADKGEYGMSVADLIGQIPYAMKERSE